LPAKGADNIAWDKLTSYADPYLTSYTRSVFGEGKDSGLGMFFTIISVLISIFLLLPTINLININISRIMERYSEIGVRKAFGASSKTLVVQFIVENILLTLLGGFIGTLLSVIVLAVLNSSGVIPYAQLGMNLWLLAGIVVTCIFFGFVSGVYPAWRMSRMDVVKALKAS
jgi:putative ABC transport system permease protein